MPLWGPGGVASSYAGQIGADYADRVRSTDTGRPKKDKSKAWGTGTGYALDALSLMFGPTAVVNAGLYGLTGESIGDRAAQAAGGPWGTAPPGPNVGPPGGSVGGGGGTQRQATAEPTLLTEEPVVPAPISAVEKEKEKRRKRIGRQETIKTSSLLSDASILKPTLLGL